jgi:hypothetical protein
MKKRNEVKEKLKKLRLSRETLQTLTSSDTQKVVGGFSPGCGGMSPQCSGASYEELCDTA